MAAKTGGGKSMGRDNDLLTVNLIGTPEKDGEWI